MSKRPNAGGIPGMRMSSRLLCVVPGGCQRVKFPLSGKCTSRLFTITTKLTDSQRHTAAHLEFSLHRIRSSLDGMSVRMIGTCVVCQDPRVQLVSNRRCAKCLMRERREAERRGEPVHNPQEHTYLKELNGYLTRLVKAATALEDAAIPENFISPEDHQTLRRILRQSIDKIQSAKRSTEHGNTDMVLVTQPVADDEKS